MSVCAIPGLNLRVMPDQLPLPEYAIEPAADGGVAVLAGGCFWCTEAVFKQLAGVLQVEPGYAGGRAERANYEAVCTGVSGHAEVIRIEYDPLRIGFGELLQVFFAVAHDATQLNRQGNDVGSQYRSAIFPQDAAQQTCAESYIRQLTEAGVFLAPIATTIEPGQIFHPAERYHHDYAARNPQQPYIRGVSAPKAEKLRSFFPERLNPVPTPATNA
jgi:peptide-methionine (S)-S-oxide reductase